MLFRSFWGRGYSGERAGALLELAFERLHLSVVSVNHRDGNERSRRASKKYVDEYGGQHDSVKRDAPTADEIEIHHRYPVTFGVSRRDRLTPPDRYAPCSRSFGYNACVGCRAGVCVGRRTSVLFPTYAET